MPSQGRRAPLLQIIAFPRIGIRSLRGFPWNPCRHPFQPVKDTDTCPFRDFKTTSRASGNTPPVFQTLSLLFLPLPLLGTGVAAPVAGPPTGEFRRDSPARLWCDSHGARRAVVATHARARRTRRPYRHQGDLGYGELFSSNREEVHMRRRSAHLIALVFVFLFPRGRNPSWLLNLRQKWIN